MIYRVDGRTQPPMVDPKVRPRREPHPLRANAYRGLVDQELVVVPPGVTPTGSCGDCGMDDGLVDWARLCRWCADLRVIKADQPPPNPGKRVQS